MTSVTTNLIDEIHDLCQYQATFLSVNWRLIERTCLSQHTTSQLCILNAKHSTTKPPSFSRLSRYSTRKQCSRAHTGLIMSNNLHKLATSNSLQNYECVMLLNRCMMIIVSF